MSKIRCLFGWHPSFKIDEYPYARGWLFVERKCASCFKIVNIWLETDKVSKPKIES